MNAKQLRRRFPRAAQGFLALNDHDHHDGNGTDHRTGDPGPLAELERDHRDEPVHLHPVQKPAAGRFLVRVVSIRKRLLDEDNISEKVTVDCCRYAGLLDSDAPEKTHIETTQRLCRKGEEEKTLIEIYRGTRPVSQPEGEAK